MITLYDFLQESLSGVKHKLLFGDREEALKIIQRIEYVLTTSRVAQYTVKLHIDEDTLKVLSQLP